MTGSGGWYELLDIVREAADLRTDELSRPPVACLECGEPLQSGPNGERYCKFDGSIWDAGNQKVGYVGTALN